MENIPSHHQNERQLSSTPSSSSSSGSSSLSSDGAPPLTDLNEEGNSIRSMPLYPHTLPPPPLQMPETNTCYEESHPHYVGLLYRLNFMDLLTRATERELQGQIIFNQQNQRESALVINQLLVENLYVKTVLAEKERELNELRVALGVQIENTTFFSSPNTTDATTPGHLKHNNNNLFPNKNGNNNNAETKVTKTNSVGRGRKNGVLRLQPTTQNGQINTKHNNSNNSNDNNTSTTSSSACSSPSSSSSSSSSTSGPRTTLLLHTSTNKNYPSYIYGSELQSQSNKNIMMIPTNMEPPTGATASTTTTSTEAKTTVTNSPCTFKEPTTLTKIGEHCQEKLATLPTKTLIKKVLIARKNSNPMNQARPAFLVQLPATTNTTTGRKPQKEFKPQIVSTVSLQNIPNTNNFNTNVDETSNNKNSPNSNSNNGGLGSKRKAHVTVRDVCRIDSNTEVPPPIKVQRRTPSNSKSKETTVVSSS